MKVFISWSGSRSKAVGILLDEWLQCVIQALNPWMSSKDIDRGSLWFSEINDQLRDTSIGIICLTHENKSKPWILFEAGALAKGLNSSRVCTLLIDLQSTDVQDPLAQFNNTLPNREGIWQLVRTLNASLGEKGIKERTLEQVFDTYWPQFESKFQNILYETEGNDTEPEVRPEQDILAEILSATRIIDKRLRKLENTPTHRETNNGTFNNIHVRRQMAEMRKLAHGFLKDGFDPDAVVEALVGTNLVQNFPKDKIEMTVMEVLRDINNEVPTI